MYMWFDQFITIVFGKPNICGLSYQDMMTDRYIEVCINSLTLSVCYFCNVYYFMITVCLCVVVTCIIVIL